MYLKLNYVDNKLGVDIHEYTCDDNQLLELETLIKKIKDDHITQAYFTIYCNNRLVKIEFTFVWKPDYIGVSYSTSHFNEENKNFEMKFIVSDDTNENFDYKLSVHTITPHKVLV
jgi:hypothetical protein